MVNTDCRFIIYIHTESISFYLPCSVYLLSLASASRTRKVHVLFPFSCTRFSTFPVRSICFLSRNRFKNEEGSCSISFYLPCSVYLLSLASASRTRKVHALLPFSCTRFSTFPVRSHHYSTLPVSQIDFR